MGFLYAVLGLLLIVAVYDLLQTRHAILRNFPLVGHLRYLLEAVGPELRQYIVTSNDEERPFSRDERRWVYASAKLENNYFGFGTDDALDRPHGQVLFRHAAFPLPDPHPGQPGYDPQHRLPCAKVLGGHRGRRKAFRPASAVNVSAMSFGSLSARAVEAVNRGVALAGALHNTGEGGISPYHLQGGDLIWQLGTGYFGARGEDGSFDLDRLVDSCAEHEAVRAIEIKLSQGAKPGIGGVLPAAKVTPEIARIRGVPAGQDCISPNGHSAFTDADSLLDFIERIADATGLPVGIKSAVGETAFWAELARLCESSGRAPDYVAVDGAEGGTGAGPLVFTDHVALPFRQGFAAVYHAFAEEAMADKVVFVGGGRLGLPENAFTAFALGCDMVAVAREAMLSIGCIQAQRCHTGHCPTGVATQRRWLMRGLDPTHKAHRCANYLTTLRKELLRLSRACGLEHPALLRPSEVEFLQQDGIRSAAERYGYTTATEMAGRVDRASVSALMRELAEVGEPAAAQA